jgi:hypothetical protein
VMGGMGDLLAVDWDHVTVCLNNAFEGLKLVANLPR